MMCDTQHKVLYALSLLLMICLVHAFIHVHNFRWGSIAIKMAYPSS